MKLILCLFDVKAQLFMQPFFVPSIGVALRNLSDEVGRVADDNILNRHPRDFRLMHLGEFDEDAGAIHSKDPQLVCEVFDLVARTEDAAQQELRLAS